MRHGPCSNHDFSRIGMGALHASFEAMFKAITDEEFKTVAFGKPQLGTFQLATRLLQQWRKDTHGINQPPDTVYFVGDTPESDVRGTNEFGESGKVQNTWHRRLPTGYQASVPGPDDGGQCSRSGQVRHSERIQQAVQKDGYWGACP